MEGFDPSEDVNVSRNGQVRWTSNSGLLLQGYCKKEYAPVKEMFEDFFKSGREKNAQLCVYVRNEVVVDLYGTAIEDSNYGPDTLAVCYSSIDILFFKAIMILMSFIMIFRFEFKAHF